jgi:hypothetical protein
MRTVPRDEVIGAIERRSPAYVPLAWWDKPEWSDVLMAKAQPAQGWQPRVPGETEWGYVFETLDPTRANFGQVRHPPGADWDKALELPAPDPDAPGRFAHLPELLGRYPDRYVLGSMGVSGFGTMTAIRGFTDLLEGLYTDPDKVLALAEKVFGYERGLIRGFAKGGVHGIAFLDDWGTQEALMVSPAQWRELFKPLYRRHFALCHELGLHVFFHSCGQVTAIVDDLIEVGADMLNLSQMTLYQKEVAAIGAGRACFVCPVDFQRTLYADPAAVEAEIASMIELFGGGRRGGIIGQTEGYVHLGCSYETTVMIADLYCRLGGRPAMHRSSGESATAGPDSERCGAVGERGHSHATQR